MSVLWKCFLFIFLAVRILVAASERESVILYLVGGGVIPGQLVEEGNEVLVVETDFAGTIQVSRAAISEIRVDQLASDELENLETSSRIEMDSDVVAETELTKEEMKASVWEFQFSFDAFGKSGNVDEFASRLRTKLSRETDENLWESYFRFFTRETNGLTNKDEVIVGSRYDEKLEDRWSLFSRIEFEKDAVEALEARGIVSAGIANELFKEFDFIFKTSLGLGYQYEDFRDESRETEFVFDLALEFQKELFKRFVFLSDWRYVSELRDFGEYRVEHETELRYQLGEESPWSFSIGLDSDYNSVASDGVDPLNHNYFSRIIYTWN